MNEPILIPDSDIELLSAYLDRQLSVAERVNLERRIEAEPALRSELESLRATTAALRALAPLRPPRSFTLDPATAPQRRRAFPLTWMMQMGSGLAGLALVLLATIQMLSVGAVPAVQTVPMAANAPVTSAADTRQSREGPAIDQTASELPAATVVVAPASVLMGSEPLPPNPTEAAYGSGSTASTSAIEPRANAAEAPASASSPGGAAPGGDGTIGSYANTSPDDPAFNQNDETAIALDNSAIQSTDTSSPDTTSLPKNEPVAPGITSFLPGLTLALGVALIAFGLLWHLYSRRSW